MKSLIAVLCLVACASAQDFVKDCGSKFAKATAVKVNGQEDKCVMRAGSTNTVQIDFDMTGDESEFATVSVSIFIQGKYQSLLYLDDNCEVGDLPCALQEGGSYSYKKSFNLVLPKLPKWKRDFKWQIQNENDVDILCLTLSCQVVY